TTRRRERCWRGAFAPRRAWGRKSSRPRCRRRASRRSRSTSYSARVPKRRRKDGSKQTKVLLACNLAGDGERVVIGAVTQVYGQCRYARQGFCSERRRSLPRRQPCPVVSCVTGLPMERRSGQQKLHEIEGGTPAADD